jgi:hypothetical protein
MKFQIKLAIITGALALSAVPALAAGPPSNSGTSHIPSGTNPASSVPTNPGTERAPTAGEPTPGGHAPTNPGTSNAPAQPGPGAPLPAKAKAYGHYCQAESHQHVDGQSGTPFSQCVTAMAKLANGQSNNPRTACMEESKQHADGQKGTPFSQCVAGGAKLLHEQEQ